MTATGEYKSRIGLDNLYIAEVTTDDAASYVADTPAWFAPAAEASLAPNTASVVQYADDQPYETISSEGETKISLSVTNIPIEMLATILGRVYDAASGRMWDNPNAVPPYFALGFRSQKSNGSYRYYWYLKGRFETPSEDIATKGEKADPKMQKIVYTAIRTIYEFDLGSFNDSQKRVVGDEDALNFDETGWFAQVQTPAASSPAALALSTSDPLDGAVGVAVSKTITLTFNNALQTGEDENCVLTLDDGTLKATTNSLDVTQKIVTVDPDTNMAAASTYLLTYAVMDIYGQHLTGVINFTTA